MFGSLDLMIPLFALGHVRSIYSQSHWLRKQACIAGVYRDLPQLTIDFETFAFDLRFATTGNISLGFQPYARYVSPSEEKPGRTCINTSFCGWVSDLINREIYSSLVYTIYPRKRNHHGIEFHGKWIQNDTNMIQLLQYLTSPRWSQRCVGSSPTKIGCLLWGWRNFISIHW